MKRIISTCIYLMLISDLLNGQPNKRNNNWAVGYQPVLIFDFNATLNIDTVNNVNSGIKSPGATISDTNGSMLFYTNGFLIYDSEGYIMDNGLYVNCPLGQVLANYYGGASLFDQTSIILPKKGNTYYVFSTGMSDSVANNYINLVYTEFDVLNYSVVDMDSNAGNGKVVQKNLMLADKQHYVNCAMQAVQHSNGKDWWLVKADCINNRYQEFLVKEDTILGPFYQTATDSLSAAFCIGGLNQIYFNDQGTQMASGIYGTLKGGVFYDFNRVDIYDFNRCDGTLTFKKYYETPYDTSTYVNDDYKQGLCFSPNGKLLYMSNKYSIYQIDLEDTNTNNALIIHGPDTSDLSYFPLYGTMGVAPDGKLYIGNDNGIRKYMSYIDSPDAKGLGCNFVAQGVWQPYTNLKSPPNMPNYGLGKDTSVVCWPLNNDELLMVNDKLEVFPNPSSTIFYIKNRKGKKKELYNMLGTLLYSTFKEEIDVNKYAKGVYMIRCEGESRKLVVE